MHCCRQVRDQDRCPTIITTSVAAVIRPKRYNFCSKNRNASTASITNQYAQFSSFTRAVNQVVKRLPQVVSESR